MTLIDCNGRMGNILGAMSLGLQLFLKRGVRLVMFPSQYQELMGCFDPSVCAEDGSTFCIVLTDGNFNFKRVYQFQFSGHFQLLICILGPIHLQLATRYLTRHSTCYSTLQLATQHCNSTFNLQLDIQLATRHCNSLLI